ncbi:hypothetical protein GYMLUDRAFT_52668 [Collybiopsis luxurians FD-317 M1]|nr:hypothetical protein GYMLUDRAFT_52668 [Collybiopsis luxurians FD-317 M1]
MRPENQRAEFHNCHKRDGSGELVLGYARTTIEGDELRDPGSTGEMDVYAAICKELSRIDWHSCCPSTISSWHTDTFPRLFAVRDLHPHTEVSTISYCDILESATKRARYLALYGIISCNCGPARNGNPAQIMLADERCARFKEGLSLGLPSFATFLPGETSNAWVQPAVENNSGIGSGKSSGML